MKSIAVILIALGILSMPEAIAQTASIVSQDVIFQETDGLLAVEAEHYYQQTHPEPRQWYIFSKDVLVNAGRDDDDPHCSTASGHAYVELLPDTRVTHADKMEDGANFAAEPGKMGVLHYRVNFQNAGKYYVWVRAYSTGAEDNGIHVGLDGQWPESGQRMQWCKGKKSWKWENRQQTEENHCGEFLQIYLKIEKPGDHEIMFSMREDGFEMDKFILTKDLSYRPDGAGSVSALAAGSLPSPFPVVTVDRAPKRSIFEAVVRKMPAAVVIRATDFYSPESYVDKNWLAINPRKRKEAIAYAGFQQKRKIRPAYDVVFLGVGENDGQSSYTVKVNGQPLGSYQPPLSEKSFDQGAAYCQLWPNVTLANGDLITVETKVGTDGKEYSRARWGGIIFVPSGQGRQVLALIDANETLPGKMVTDAVQPARKGPDITGERKTWHPVTFTFDGPKTSETDGYNPFANYRLDVTFYHLASGKKYVVPGYFAADGDAANTSATSGNKWRVHFTADEVGEWVYQVEFRKGLWQAVSERGYKSVSGSFMDGYIGTIAISKTDKGGDDFRGKGRLKYVGERYLRFAETGEYFLKVGSDAPENMLAYEEFDGTFHDDGHKDELVKTWEAHEKHWRENDPTWQGDKGKDIIGAINYLRSKGLNAFSFITNNIMGDDQNVFPYIDYDTYDRMDISKLAQWDVLFTHADSIGMFLHVKLMEAENQGLLDHGGVGFYQKLYYREMIARFGHHLAMNWNICEESGHWLSKNVTPPQYTAERLAAGNYFKNHDPYQHHLVIHNGVSFDDILGPQSPYTGPSLQTNRADFRNVHSQVLRWINASKEAGKPWAVACDEPGDAQHSLLPDEEDSAHDDARVNGLWGAFLAGGWGTEWYFGYKHPHSDLSCQDYATRDLFWEQGKIALDFFQENELPFWEMDSHDEMILTEGDFAFAKPGEVYVFLVKRGTSKVDLSSADGQLSVRWYNPRQGGALQKGRIKSVTAAKEVDLGVSPDKDDKDWVVLVRK